MTYAFHGERFCLGQHFDPLNQSAAAKAAGATAEKAEARYQYYSGTSE